jgi:hypothetical protein
MKSFFFGLMLVSISCTSGKKTPASGNLPKAVFQPQFTPGPPVLVYKTKANYQNLVPVLLSDDKSQIISYPHPGDLKVENQFSYPGILRNGYLLDNRGINSNVAFLKLTYEEYSGRKEAPDLLELFQQIIDKDPLAELCDCGNKAAFSDIEKQLNQLIEEGRLRTVCKVLK